MTTLRLRPLAALDPVRLETDAKVDESGFDLAVSTTLESTVSADRLLGFAMSSASAFEVAENGAVLVESFTTMDVRFSIHEPTTVRLLATVSKEFQTIVPFPASSVRLTSSTPGFAPVILSIIDPGIDSLAMTTVLAPGLYTLVCTGSAVLDNPPDFEGTLQQAGSWSVDLAALPSGSCAGDCDGSGAVDFAGLVSTLFAFGDPGAPIACDADGNGSVDFADLVAALFAFGPCAG